jgi:hypothetical protein
MAAKADNERTVKKPVNLPARRTSGIAIASLVCGFAFVIPFAPVAAIILGIVALVKIRRQPSLDGKWLAVAGIVLGVIVLIFHIWLLVVFITGFFKGIAIVGDISSSLTRLENLTFEEGYATCLTEPPDLQTGELEPSQQAEIDELVCFSLVANIHPLYLAPPNDPFCGSLTCESVRQICMGAMHNDPAYCDQLAVEQRDACLEMVQRLTRQR